MFLRAMLPLSGSSCTANKVGTPMLAMGGMLQRIWMLGTLPRMANQCPPLLYRERGGGLQETTC